MLALKIIAGLTLLLTGLVLVRFWSLATQSGSIRPTTLGVKDGRLAPCPAKPNCVSSQAPPHDEKHAIAPLAFSGAPAQAKEKLLQILNSKPQVTLVESGDSYVHTEFKSGIFGFVDDVEFYFPNDGSNLIHVRSASRVGYSDFGANRKRIEQLRVELK
jgi:uncharacterized protein (DUF1499 family)